MIIIAKLLLLAISIYSCASKKDWLAGMTLALIIVILLDGLVVGLVQ